MPDPLRCSECHSPLDKADRFCRNCGAPSGSVYLLSEADDEPVIQIPQEWLDSRVHIQRVIAVLREFFDKVNNAGFFAGGLTGGKFTGPAKRLRSQLQEDKEAFFQIGRTTKDPDLQETCLSMMDQISEAQDGLSRIIDYDGIPIHNTVKESIADDIANWGNQLVMRFGED